MNVALSTRRKQSTGNKPLRWGMIRELGSHEQRAERRCGRKEQSMSAKESRIRGKSGLVKHKDSWKDNTDGWAGEQATTFGHSHMYVLVLV